MNEILKQTLARLLVGNKGILAADESFSSADKRLSDVGITPSVETRRLYRELFLNTPGIEEYLSGVILFDETTKQASNDGVNFVDLLKSKGIVPGIKVDGGLVDLENFPGEKIAEGLDGLATRLDGYFAQGLRFAKWRTVTVIGDETPTMTAIIANSHVLARYAAICQSRGIVPMVEPEVLIDGDHDINKSEEVTTGVINELFSQLKNYRVDLSALILKTSMVISGKGFVKQATPEEVGAATVRMLRNSVPEAVPGVVFLSGGQSPEAATENLNAIKQFQPLPWQVTFSYARAIQQPALEIWRGKEGNVELARAEFVKTLKRECAAVAGRL